jgi:hypothetical protein
MNFPIHILIQIFQYILLLTSPSITNVSPDFSFNSNAAFPSPLHESSLVSSSLQALSSSPPVASEARRFHSVGVSPSILVVLINSECFLDAFEYN